MSKKNYNLPNLTKILLKNIIFSMENQNSKGYLDLSTGEIIEVQNKNDIVIVNDDDHNVALKIADNKDRFLAIPLWGPLEGFKIREQFVVSLINPVYREKLDKVLHNGRGVFRKFKDVLHTNPIILQQWYLFKADYMKAIVVQWYEENKGIIKLEKLPEDIEEMPNDLLLQEFEIDYNDETKKDEIKNLRNFFLSSLNEIESILIKRRIKLIKDSKYISVTSFDDKVVGFIEYEVVENNLVEIISYGILEEFRGLGLFSLLLDRLMRQLKRENILKVLMFLPSKFNINTINFKKIDTSCNLNYFIVDISVWIETMATTELLEV